MDQDLTQFQSPDDIQKAEKLSREGNQPPAEVPGYEIHGLVGSGAYGEVWAGTDRNTGRKVAIKFYSRRASVDFSLLSREVEKLASLAADRYVVQLLDVGWDASPPYYVMDFIENGSLEDELRRRGPFSIEEATEMFQEVAIGLMHLHNKGILHCDLKPGNVLLDNEQKPRLADFGQSRLSTEQVPALGTLFYMAPEQANLEAIPDAKWDVYALGALMYCMLTGYPPHRTDDASQQLESASELGERLAMYQRVLKHAPTARDHRDIPGIDKQLTDIVDRCIAVDPGQRFENVQGVLLALRQREEFRARRPLLLLGMIGPFVLLCIMAIFGFALYSRSIAKAEDSLMGEARKSNAWAAQFASQAASDEVDKFFSSVQRLSQDEEFLSTFNEVIDNPELEEMRERLADPNAAAATQDLKGKFVAHSVRKKLQPLLEAALDESAFTEASWFCTDRAGNQLAFASEDGSTNTIGKNYAWRTYFHGGPEDLKKEVDGKTVYDINRNANQRQHISKSHLSAIFISQASQRWKVAFSMPLFRNGDFAGVLAATAHCGDFVTFKDRPEQYAMLVDFRPGPNRGAILGHPYINKYAKEGKRLPDGFLEEQKLDPNQVVATELFEDPLAQHDEKFAGQWIVGRSPIERTLFDNLGRPSVKTGLVVLAVEDSQAIMRPVVELGRQILLLGVASIAMIVAVGIGFWFLAIRSAKESQERVNRVFRSATETSPPPSRKELTATSRGESTHA